MPRGVLDKALKDRLYDVLLLVPSVETLAGRTAILDGLPQNIRIGLNRSENTFVDLTNLINQLDQLGRLDNGERPVVMMVNNAWRMTRGSELGLRLQELQADIEKEYGFEPPLPELPDTPEVLIFGGEGEWVSVSFIEQAQTAGRQVARLSVPRFMGGQEKRGVGLGTGWLVAPHLMLTNHHVIAARDMSREQPVSDTDFKIQGEHTIAWFDYHREGEHTHMVAAKELVASSRELDYALLRLEDSPDLAVRYRMVLTPRNAPLQQGVRLNIVQCPGGGPLRFAIRNNFFVGTGEKRYQIRYLTDTVPGSSGSPVLDDNWQVVAMHRGAKEVNPQLYKGEAGKSDVVKYHNEGIGIHEILSGLPDAPRKEIEAAQGWA
jgi:V8-like Glu-specific endopeptidase